MRGSVIRSMSFVALALIATGSMDARAVEPATEAHGGGRDADKFPPPVPPDQLSPWFGGGGGAVGGSMFDLRCEYVGGVVTDIGNYVEGLALECLDSRGSWVGQTPHVGGKWSTPVGLTCPRGFHPSGLYGRAGSYVDALGLICTNGMVSMGVAPMRGGRGGDEFYWECPAGYSFSGVVGRAGSVIDALQIRCKYDP